MRSDDALSSWEYVASSLDNVRLLFSWQILNEQRRLPSVSVYHLAKSKSNELIMDCEQNCGSIAYSHCDAGWRFSDYATIIIIILSVFWGNRKKVMILTMNQSIDQSIKWMNE